MSKTANQKLRILYVQRILHLESDPDHFLSVPQIQEKLEHYGIVAERKSIYDDLEQLETFGENLLRRRGKDGGVALAEGTFELAELKLLIDMVQSSLFVTDKKSRSLISKLSSFCSRYQSDALKRHVYIKRRTKAENEAIFYAVDRLNEAINRKCQISFRYFDRDPEGKKIYRGDGSAYLCSPWELTVSDGRYYLIAYVESKGRMQHFRVDKMEKITLSEMPRSAAAQKLHNDLDLASYTEGVFGMFGGETVGVTLVFPGRLSGVLFDRFGKDLRMQKEDSVGERYSCHVKVVPSGQFFGWLASFEGAMTVRSPLSVAKDYQQHLTAALRSQVQASEV